jgi:hypothetical protein
LLASAARCNLYLRHAGGNQLCDEFFPVHDGTITGARYFDKRFFVSGLP